MEIPFTKHSVMECFWRPVMDSMCDKESTTEQITTDVKDFETLYTSDAVDQKAREQLERTEQAAA